MNNHMEPGKRPSIQFSGIDWEHIPSEQLEKRVRYRVILPPVHIPTYSSQTFQVPQNTAPRLHLRLCIQQP